MPFRSSRARVTTIWPSTAAPPEPRSAWLQNPEQTVTMGLFGSTCETRSWMPPVSTLYQSSIPSGSDTTVNGANLFYPGKSTADQYSGTLRVDQNFGNNNQVMFRYSQFDLFKTNPSGTIGNAFVHVPGHNYIGHWTHTFSPTAFTDVYFGRNYGYTYIGT